MPSNALRTPTVRSPRFPASSAASSGASLRARASSRKRDTRCERELRRALWRRGLRYRVDRRELPGRPDIVFVGARVVVFCDGDFWHGRDLPRRLERLAAGHNAPYWVAKIESNVGRDRRINRQLVEQGWTVLRFWEGEILEDVEAVADRIESIVERCKAR